MRRGGKRVFVETIMAFFAIACATPDGGGTVSRIAGAINGEPVVPRHANSIVIGDFDDATARKDIAGKTAMKVRELVNRDGRLAVVPAGGDLELFVALTSFQVQVLEFGPRGIPVKKRMRLTGSLKLLDAARNTIIFRNNAVQSFIEYSEITPPVTPEYLALDLLVERMAERIKAQTITGWYTEYMTKVEKGNR